MQWREDFGAPEAGKLVRLASVWLLYYPGSVITKPGESVIGTWAEPKFWDSRAGYRHRSSPHQPDPTRGRNQGREFTPTIDGWFDRIGLDTAPELGTEEEYRRMVDVADEREARSSPGTWCRCTPALGPTSGSPSGRTRTTGHVQHGRDRPGGLGAASRRSTTPGAPPSSRGRQPCSCDEKGYIPGLINSADASRRPTNGAAGAPRPRSSASTAEPRRWVYLHVFKPGQPTLNWLDPTYAARRVQFGDAARNILDRGVQGPAS